MKQAVILIFAAMTAMAAGMASLTPSKVCAKCHPVIYKEYMASMHRKSSVADDPVHAAVWAKHPLKNKGKYRCAVCHSPQDGALMQALAEGGPALPGETGVQKNEPIGCAYCHRIEAVRQGTAHNENVLHPKRKYYFAAKNGKAVNETVSFHAEKGWFGLSRATGGSPFHTIDHGNRLFADGGMCLGCHDHKRNKKGFAVCELKSKKEHSGHNCITCHMPQVPGSFSTITQSRTHAYHGFASLHNGTDLLKRYVKLDAKAQHGKLVVTIKNEADHRLFNHPLRLAQLRITVKRGDKTLPIEPVNFYTILGHDGKPAMPWVADTVLKSSTIEARATRTVETVYKVKKGDTVEVTLGYYIVNPKAAAKLGLAQSDAAKFRVLKRESFFF